MTTIATQEKIVYPDTVTLTDTYVEVRPDPKMYNIPEELLEQVHTKTIWNRFEEVATRKPDHRYLGVREYDKEKKAFADHYTFNTLGETLKLAEQAGAGWVALGLEAGDIVSECSHNRPEWLIAELGVIRQAAAVAPLRVEMDHSYYEPIVVENKSKYAVVEPEKVDDILTLCENIRAHGHELTYRAIVVFPYAQGPRFGDETLSAAQEARAEALGVRLVRWEAFLALGEQQPCGAGEQKPSNLYMIIYTSGTTSNRPKGTLLTQQSLMCEHLRQYHFIAEDSVYYSYISMSHISEHGTVSLVLGYGVTVGFASGGVDTFLDDFEVLKPTQFTGVPLLLKALYLKAMAAVRATGNRDMVNAIFKKKFGGGSCRFCMTFGAPMSMDIVRWMVEDMDIVFTNNYGSTEVAGSLIMTPLSKELPPVGNIGFPEMLVKARIVDIPELGYSVKSTPPCGELVLQYPGLPLGYLNNPDKTKELLDDDGWLHTNDVAQVNPDGSLSLVDRKDNMMKLVNAKYVPAEKIESLLGLSPIISKIWVYCEPTDTFIVTVIVPEFNVLALVLPDGPAKELCLAIAKNPAAEGGLAFCENPLIKKIFLDEVHKYAEKNCFPSFWVLKDVLLDTCPWNETNGLMTFTSKLKRKALVARYKPRLDVLLEGIRKEYAMFPEIK